MQYFLAYGTLLGAVRHRGFIPWDDDVDVVMPRSDYNEFIRMAKDGIGIDTMLSVRTSAKIVHPRVTMTNFRIILDSGFYGIDIFPLDVLPKNYLLELPHCIKLRFYTFSLNLNIAKAVTASSLKRAIIKTICIPFFRFLNTQKLVKRISAFSQKYKDYEAQFVIQSSLIHGIRKERMDKKIFSSVMNMEFENNMFKVPIGYDEYLTQIYGDYMQLPPENKRVSHHQMKVFRIDQ